MVALPKETANVVGINPLWRRQRRLQPRDSPAPKSPAPGGCEGPKREAARASTRISRYPYGGLSSPYADVSPCRQSHVGETLKRLDNQKPLGSDVSSYPADSVARKFHIEFFVACALAKAILLTLATALGLRLIQ